MKKTIPLIFLLIIGAGLGGFYLGKRSSSIPSPSKAINAGDNCGLCDLVKKYKAPSRVTPIEEVDGESMRNYYGNDNGGRTQTKIIKTDAISFAYYFNLANMKEKTDSIEFVLAKHIKNPTIGGTVRQYKDRFSTLITFTKIDRNNNKKYVLFEYTLNGQTKKTPYLDIMTLCPYDCKDVTK